MTNKLIRIVCYIIIAILIFSSCDREKNKEMVEEGQFWGVTNHEYLINEPIIKFKIDQYMALDIGTAVLKHVFGEDKIKNTTFIVEELKNQDAYAVCRQPKMPKGVYMAGGGYCVAIKKSTGQILCVWTGE